MRKPIVFRPGWPLAAGVLIGLLAASSPAWARGPWTITGAVDRIDLEDPSRPKLTVYVLQAEGPLKPDRLITFTVPLTKTPQGCIDLSRPENRTRAAVLALKPGDTIEAAVTAGQRELTAERVRWIGRADEVSFPGRDKIKDPTLIPRLRYGGGRVGVIVLLKNDGLACAAASVEASEVAKAEIRRRQDELLAALPAGSFELRHRYANLPALAGRADLAGLKALAAWPTVAVIQADRPVRFD